MPAHPLEVSIVMPCLNEAESLPYCLEKAFRFLETSQINGEVIVADNGSTDGSTSIASSFGVKLVIEPLKGYGSAISAGVRVAEGKYIIIGDADDSYDFSELQPLIEHLRNGSDLVMGNRFKGGIKKNAMPFLHRYIGNPVLSFLGRVFFKISIGDFHCGLRAIKRESFEKLNLKTTGMEFASEMVVKAALFKLQITESPVILYPDKRGRSSHLRTWHDGWRHLRFLLLYSPRWLFLLPGIFLMICGAMGSFFLISGPVEIASKKLDIHTLVYTSGFIIMGFQLVSFYLLSRLYASVSNLFPDNGQFIKFYNKYMSLEKGIIIGFVAFVFGICLMFKSFFYWQRTEFGNLDSFVVLRWVIPSVVLMILGLQIVSTFFCLSFYTIKSRN